MVKYCRSYDKKILVCFFMPHRVFSNTKECFYFFVTLPYTFFLSCSYSIFHRQVMPVSGIWLVAQQFVTTSLYLLLRLVFILVQRIYWKLNGTAQKLREARLPQNYERSAQVLDVVFAHKFCPMQMTTFSNFLCTHNRFENPQYIIDNDNITLMTINDHNAIFCEPAEKGRQ